MDDHWFVIQEIGSNMMNRLPLFVCTFFVFSVPALALELPAIFSDHMVLQRNMPVPVWGTSEPGQSITVTFGEVEAATVAGENGVWRVDLPAMEANADPVVLSVVAGDGKDEVSKRFKNVLVGEVWHCSGQSNMRWKVMNAAGAEAEIAAADYPLIRHFSNPMVSKAEPQFSTGGQWQVASPETIGGFSAVGFYFGRALFESQGVPIGLYQTAWGGASAEAYTSRQSLESSPVTAGVVLEYDEKLAAASHDKPVKKQHIPAALWNGMIHPVAPFAHRGVIWYQGENNANRGVPLEYRTLLPMMIEDWRELWSQPGEARDFPFLIVQLASFRKHPAQPPAYDDWAELRDSQAAVAAATKNTWATTAIDLGDANDIHPRNKQDVGRRFARLAERYVYGNKSVVPVGPQMYAIGYDSTEPGVATVRWNFAEGLTTTDDQPPRGFAIRRNPESNWVWANAEIEPRKRDTVRLTHPEGFDGPFEIRYAFSVNPADGPQGINLVNAEGLPAMPFRTDPVPTLD
ncbi:sialate O-acetylesterase [Algisphaera agarilytica]|uniref:Sialate O-acetylesterase n=1 Tax=Algisphaera agarilytica TaxID=1385975 RepID=A0A7X0HA55_9BACT|nr:sialate O-acetylesterase [Algisphaera agarilytica]MBB6430645.1 sialate O-acetylesterase [Algisphaera agarilytica]